MTSNKIMGVCTKIIAGLLLAGSLAVMGSGGDTELAQIKSSLGAIYILALACMAFVAGSKLESDGAA